MRALLTLLLLAILAVPAAAQDFERPAGWNVRFDRKGATEADLGMFVEMPPGWHITTGPAGIFWDPANTASGDFRVEMEVFLFDPGRRREAFGFFFGGSDLEGPDPRYTYFLIRNGGEFILKERRGGKALTLIPWTANDAILSFADRGENPSVKNVLAVECRRNSCTFEVNGQEVGSVARGDIPTEGTVGLRVNHALNLHVSRLDISSVPRTPSGPSDPTVKPRRPWTP